MKKFYSIFTIAAAALSALSCDQEKKIEVMVTDSAKPYFNATIEAPAGETKVYANEDLHLRWNRQDEISVFDHLTYNRKYIFTGDDGDSDGKFELIPEGTFITGAEMPYVYAVYPYREDHSLQLSGGLYISIPQTQEYACGTFSHDANIMISVTEDDDLYFKNLCGYLMFKIYGEGLSISAMELNAMGRPVSGDVLVSMEPGGEPTFSWMNSSTGLMFQCPVPVELGCSAADATEFLMVVPPVIMSDGFTLYVYLSDGRTFMQEYNGSLEITRNHLTRMAPFKVDVPPMQYFLNPQTGEKAVIHWTQSWWGETVDTYLKYLEEDGVRTCLTETIPDSHAVEGDPYTGYGFWGQCTGAGMGEWTLIWYTNAQNNLGYDLIQLDTDTGYYHSKYNAEIWACDYYSWRSRFYGENYTPWVYYAQAHGDPDGDHPCSYYDGNGGFYLFVNNYFMGGVGGWSPATYDTIGIAEGFDRSE